MDQEWERTAQKHRLEQIKKSLSDTVKTLARKDDLSINFLSDRTLVNDHHVTLPHLPARPTSQDITLLRGAGDAAGLRLSSHSSFIHAQYAPLEPEAREVFDAVEQARIEALGAKKMAGLANNINEVTSQRLRQHHCDKAREKTDIPLHEALSIMLKQRISGRDCPQLHKDVAQFWHDDLNRLADDLLDELSKNASDQQAFAKIAKQLLVELDLVRGANDQELSDDPVEQDEADADESEQSDGENEQHPSDEAEQSHTETDKAGDQTDPSMSEAMMAALGQLDQDDAQPDLNDQDADQPCDSEHNWDKAHQAPSYKIFTTAFDEIVRANELATPDELDHLRAQLDKQLARLSSAVSRLANKLQRQLLAQQNRAWDFDLEEGLLDSARLTRIVTDPMQPLSFKQERDVAFKDTVVTLLIDNSGSMRGRPISTAAICADILARTLERCSVKVEILGFTTKAWKGGEAKQAWIEAGRSRQPGRLNDIRHIIYKSASEPWRRAKNHLGLMLREGLLKENIDGEALIWAHQRLLTRPEQRRILMVISDGAPVDDSTQSQNCANYLDMHLSEVIEEIEKRSVVELIAIGIGHDVTRHYQRAVTITDAEELAGAMTDKLAELFQQNTAWSGQARPN